VVPPVTEPSRAVFLSYASQDAEAAARICNTLRAAGIDVWFDQSELRGGDAWDQSIRKQIKNCALFIPLISQHTHERAEGYFRLEWKLAVDRSHLIMTNKAFLVPVVVDDTGDDDENVPERFRELQWTRLAGGQTPPEFVRRIGQLLSGEASAAPMMSRVPAAVAPGKSARFKPALLAATVVLAALAGYLLVGKPWVPTSVAFTPPPHSIAVLPFVNLSGDKEQEYFSDGLTEELLNSLAEINQLQVAGRTSSFYFKGKDADLGTIARKLNVGAVLEGSVRRSGNTVRVTTQLINAVTGFHLWSHTYDRDLGDVLKLETDIAAAVASALKVTLLGDVAARIEFGGTRNPAAFDAYLRGRKANMTAHAASDLQTAIAEYSDAIGLDPNYALAFAGRSLSLSGYAEEASEPAIVRESFDKAKQDALKALALVPDLAEGHLALATSFEQGSLEFARANEEFERALALAPGNARVLQDYSYFAVSMGRKEAAIAAARRAVLLDPLARPAHLLLGLVLNSARQYNEAVAAFRDTLTLDPNDPAANANLGLAYYGLGNLQSALTSCERKTDWYGSQVCLAIVYNKLGRHADAEAMLAKLTASMGKAAAYDYAQIYAQWGNAPKALEWLEKALQFRAPDLERVKMDPLLDPLRNEPRFRAIERELKFPQ
jgi:TolB-like protein